MMMFFNREIILRKAIPQTQLFQKRTIARFPVTSPLGIRLHSVSKAVLRGILLFYGSAFVIGGASYAGLSYYVSKYQPISTEWPFLATVNARVGVYYQDIKEDYRDPNREIERFNEALRILGEESGEAIDKNDESESHGKFKLLPLNKLENKSKDWQKTYVDIVIRLAMAKAEIGDLENANKLVLYSTRVPIDIGSLDLRSKSLRLVSKILTLKGEDPEKAENYLLDAVRFNEIHHDDIHFKANGSVLLDASSKLNRETFQSLLDLGVLYSRQEKYSKSLEIFLNLLQITESENFKEIEEHADAPLLKSYIGEILYRKGMIENSLKWSQDAYTEASFHAKANIAAAVVSQHSLQNCISLYKKLGNEEKAQELEKVLSEIVIPARNETSWKSAKDLFFSF